MIGTVKRIINTERESNLESKDYYRIVVYKDNKYCNLLLTLNDLVRFEERESKNSEDCIKPSLWQKFIHWIIR